MDAWVWFGVGVLVGVVGIAAVFLRRVTALQAKLASANNRAEMLDQQLVAGEKTEARLKDTFAALSAQALKGTSEQFLTLAETKFKEILSGAKGDFKIKQEAIDNLVKPIKELLEDQKKAVTELEKKREGAYRAIEEQIRMIAESHAQLNTETHRLVTALRRPEQRGRWGEMQLRNVVEMAGMSMHCDFDEQVTVWQGDARQRPDMIARMPGGGVIVIDSKVALEAYLDSIQPDADREALLHRHADAVETHYRSLAKKEYWNQFERTPKLVVMFMPLESALMAALEVKPDLHANAMRQHVLIATPTLLVALLRAVAYGWQQEDIAANAREISNVGEELYGRLSKFVGDLDDLGKHLTRASKAYNTAAGSFERRVLPSTRKLKELHATTSDDVEPPSPVEVEVRHLDVDELRSLPSETAAEYGTPPESETVD